AELVNLPFDHAADRLRQLALEVRGGLGQFPGTAVPNDDPAVAQVAEQIDHEERIAFRPGVEDAREVIRELMPDKGHRHVAGDVATAQVRQGDLTTDTSPLQFQLYKPEGVLAPQEVRRAIRQHEQQGEPRELAPEVGE